MKNDLFSDLSKRAIRISPDGYRTFFRKYRSIINNLDARLTDENKLLFASLDFLRKLHSDVSEYIFDVGNDEIAENEEITSRPKTVLFEDDKIFEETNPYKAILHVIDALIEFRLIAERQPGLQKLVQRFSEDASKSDKFYRASEAARNGFHMSKKELKRR